MTPPAATATATATAAAPVAVSPIAKYRANAAELASARSSVSQIDEAQLKAAEAERAALASAPEIDALERQLEDLIAANAIQPLPPQDFATRSGALQAERDRLQEIRDAAEGEAAAARRLANGLARKLTSARDRVTELEAERLRLLDAVLRSEAAEIGATYLSHARIVRSAFLQLMALNQMLRLANGGAKPSKSPFVRDASAALSFHLPGAFDLEGFAENVYQPHKELFTAGYHVTHHIESMVSAECARLRELGVDVQA